MILSKGVLLSRVKYLFFYNLFRQKDMKVLNSLIISSPSLFHPHPFSVPLFLSFLHLLFFFCLSLSSPFSPSIVYFLSFPSLIPVFLLSIFSPSKISLHTSPTSTTPSCVTARQQIAESYFKSGKRRNATWRCVQLKQHYPTRGCSLLFSYFRA